MGRNRDYEQVLTPLARPVLTEDQQQKLLAYIDEHNPTLRDTGRRIADSEPVTDREVDTIVGFLGETNNGIHLPGEREGPEYVVVTAIYDAISREYWGIGRRVGDFDARFQQRDTAEAAARMERECKEGVRVVGTVIAHEAFGMFLDVGWSALGLVLHGAFPNDPIGPREFPDLGSTVLVEVFDPEPRGRQIHMRMIGPAATSENET